MVKNKSVGLLVFVQSDRFGWFVMWEKCYFLISLNVFLPPLASVVCMKYIPNGRLEMSNETDEEEDEWVMILRPEISERVINVAGPSTVILSFAGLGYILYDVASCAAWTPMVPSTTMV